MFQIHTCIDAETTHLPASICYDLQLAYALLIMVINYYSRGTANFFLDKYRDPKEIQEEILKKRLKTLDPFEGDLEREIKYPNAHHPHPDSREAKGKPHERLELGPTWRLREIERERLRTGLYKDLDWFEPRRDPCN